MHTFHNGACFDGDPENICREEANLLFERALFGDKRKDFGSVVIGLAEVLKMGEVFRVKIFRIQQHNRRNFASAEIKSIS